MTDINECNESNGGCSHNCNNTEGSFECFCRDGYILDDDGKNCSGTRVIYIHIVYFIFIDINECAGSNGGCSHNCSNNEGSFECLCRDGYILDGDGKNCLGTRVIYIHIVYFIFIDINECAGSNGGCSHNCNNTEGSFECFCRDGYILDGDGKNCSGIYIHIHVL